MQSKPPGSPDGVSTVEFPVALAEALEAKIASGAFDFPPLPEVATEVLRATQQENVDARKLADLVRRDQALAANILRIANSPLFGGSVQIVSVQQALSRLGLAQVREMALLVACKGEVFSVPGFQTMVKNIFRHSLAAGAFAQQAARAKRLNPEEAFLSGLMHDVGRPILLRTIVDVSKKLNVEATPDAVVGFVDEHHARVGALFATAWKLPGNLARTIENHHEDSPPPEIAQIVRLTQLGDFFASTFVDGHGDEAWLRSTPVLASLNFYADEIDALIKKTPDVVALVEQLS